MKFSKSIFKSNRLPNSIIMLFAILCAICMYYYVSVREMLETQLEINLDYTGIPGNLVITSGLASQATVRLRGPETLIRSIPRSMLSETVDLSSIKKGLNIVPMNLPVLESTIRAFDIIDIQPVDLRIQADSILERTVPVRIVPHSPLGTNAVTVGNETISPSTVVLRGPEEKVSNISYVEGIIYPDSQSAGNIIEQVIPLTTPSMVVASPSSVRVHYRITSGRTVISRKCIIKISGDDNHEYSISPTHITLLVEVPEALAKNSKYLDQLQATVIVPPMEVGEEKKVKLRINLPDGMKQTNPGIDTVTITRH